MTSAPSNVATDARSGQEVGGRVEGRDVGKVYTTRDGDSLTAIDGVSFAVDPGEFVCIVGPSGCGKSTLLRIVLGLTSASSGEVHVGGDVVRGPRSDAGIVFQQALLLPWLTVLGNVLLPVTVQRRGRKAYEERAMELLRLVGLQGFEKRFPSELSGGMQQRVAIARALIHQPAYLLMDEPFGALDALTRETMNVELQRIWMRTGATVVLITHSIQEAVFLGDKVFVMSQRPGRIVDTVDVPFDRPRSLDLLTDPEFGRIVGRIRSHLTTSGTGID